MSQLDRHIQRTLQQGIAIPAHPLALNANRKLDERRQRALSRYYIEARAGGLAVGVHTTQFAIRQARHLLYEPVLAIAAEEMDRADGQRSANEKLVRVAGVVGKTEQAIAEATLARDLGYHAALLGLGALKDDLDDRIVDHCRRVAQIIPVIGFYLQAAVGGRPLSYDFWCRFAEIDNVVAIKVAAFNRYQTLDVLRALAESGRDDIALYTGNDDNIVLDLMTPHRFQVEDRIVERRFVGGLLGHWAVWTYKAVHMLRDIQAHVRSDQAVPFDWLAKAIAVTDCNAVFFDAENNFAGCIPGIHEILRRQGLFEQLTNAEAAHELDISEAAASKRYIRALERLEQMVSEMKEFFEK